MARRSNSLPGKPLAAVIRKRFPVLDDVACKRVGIAARDEFRWKVGECHPTASSVDKVLTKMGLHWWDVWNEDTVREYLFTAVSYRLDMKKNGRGVRVRCRVVTRTREYHDMGTDFYELRRIQQIMEPEWTEEAA